MIHKVTSITDSKDLSQITVDELVGSLIAHEQILAQLDKEENKAKNEKPIALKAITSNTNEQESGSDEEEIARPLLVS